MEFSDFIGVLYTKFQRMCTDVINPFHGKSLLIKIKEEFKQSLTLEVKEIVLHTISKKKHAKNTILN